MGLAGFTTDLPFSISCAPGVPLIIPERPFKAISFNSFSKAASSKLDNCVKSIWTLVLLLPTEALEVPLDARDRRDEALESEDLGDDIVKDVLEAGDFGDVFVGDVLEAGDFSDVSVGDVLEVRNFGDVFVEDVLEVGDFGVVFVEDFLEVGDFVGGFVEEAFAAGEPGGVFAEGDSKPSGVSGGTDDPEGLRGNFFPEGGNVGLTEATDGSRGLCWPNFGLEEATDGSRGLRSPRTATMLSSSVSLIQMGFLGVPAALLVLKSVLPLWGVLYWGSVLLLSLCSTLLSLIKSGTRYSFGPGAVRTGGSDFFLAMVKCFQV
jgi:hypothetical protein